MKDSVTRISRLAAVAVAGGAVGLVATVAVAGGEPERAPAPIEQTAVADWAVEQNLTGLSPASLNSTEAAATMNPGEAMDAIADFADQHGLTGLSPASLHPIEEPATQP